MGYCLPSYILMVLVFTFWNVSTDNKHVIPIERRFENLSERTMLCSHVSMTNWPCLPKRQHHWSAIIGFSCVDGYVLLNTKIAIRIWFSGCNFFCILVIIFSYIRNFQISNIVTIECILWLLKFRTLGMQTDLSLPDYTKQFVVTILLCTFSLFHG